MDFDSAVERTEDWRARLQQVKTDNPPGDFSWYGYDILGNIGHIDGLLPPSERDILARIAGQPIADIGTADGDLGLLFADMGHAVDLIDWPATNWNGMRGVRRLTELLQSSASVHEIDLDSQFRLPRDRYGLVLLLGILYHLKNPFYVLEKLASHSRYCLISTRIARFSKDPRVELEGLPVAYLLDPDECNNDASNYWIFTAHGIERMARRCGFKVLASRRLGDSEDSNPSDPDRDERIFMLLESVR
jgi:tRNA (mo5U34)-methyltransferase